jgi:hypothetical protein
MAVTHERPGPTPGLSLFCLILPILLLRKPRRFCRGLALGEAEVAEWADSLN